MSEKTKEKKGLTRIFGKSQITTCIYERKVLVIKCSGRALMKKVKLIGQKLQKAKGGKEKNWILFSSIRWISTRINVIIEKNLRFNIRGQNKGNSIGFSFFNKETAHTWLKAFPHQLKILHSHMPKKCQLEPTKFTKQEQNLILLHATERKGDMFRLAKEKEIYIERWR